MDLDAFLSLSRLSGLALSPDGRRLVVTAAIPDENGKRFRSAVWQLDPEGEEDARRLTRSAKGESGAVFTADGRLLFTSTRPDPSADDDGREEPTLWELPDRGEAVLRLELPAGIEQVAVARDANRAVLMSSLFVGAETLNDDETRAEAREEAGVSAQLHDRYPIRFWDRWLGPRESALFHLQILDGELEPELLARGLEFLETQVDLTPDGATLVARVVRTSEPDVRERPLDLIAIDIESGERRTLVADGSWYHDPAVSPDGSLVAAIREDPGAPDRATELRLVVVDMATGTTRVIAQDVDLWPANPRWLPDGSAIVFEADQDGHHPLFRTDLETGDVTRLVPTGSYSDVCPHPDGERLFALRSTVDRPPHPVVLGTTGADQDPTELRSPVSGAAGVGRVERLVASADDGVDIGSWLVMPEPASASEPAPLVVFIHGGPHGSWNAWHWRWNPHLLVEHGYAVLLPDPALSTGYGQPFIERGWGEWGERPYTDLLTTVDAACSHEAIDASRIGAMGGSFGGYMANWIAGHTDRFRCIITHASLWHLEAFHGTTDLGPEWEREFGDPYQDPSRYRENSPHRFVDRIETPMLVIHGEKDYRVPMSEALTLWTDLARHGVDAKFLYFPDENHWVLKPNNIRIWYRTVAAFLDEHLRGTEWERPDLL